jgi:hypothetical protein
MEKIELNGAQHLNNYSIVIFRFSIRFALEQLFFAIFLSCFILKNRIQMRK